jgi:hypothetical protein
MPEMIGTNLILAITIQDFGKNCIVQAYSWCQSPGDKPGLNRKKRGLTPDG